MSKTYYYSAKELSGLPGSVQGVIDRAKRDDWPSRQRAGKGGGREYPEIALPRDTRQYLESQRISACLPATIEPEQLPAVAEFDGLTITDSQRLERDARKAIVAEIARLQTETNCSQDTAINTLLTLAKLGQLSPVLARQLELARDKRGANNEVPCDRTIRRWIKADSLVPKVKQKSQAMPAWAGDFLKCYQRPQKPSVSMAYAEFKSQYHGSDCPSIHKVRRFLEMLPKIHVEKGRMGPRELKSIKPFVRRAFEDLWPNDVWSADGHCFDAEVQHPFHGRPFRPEVTAIVDVGDRSVTGFSVSLSEASLTTVDALRHAFTRSGIPAIFYVDNGSGYANEMLKDEAVGILGRFGTEVKHSLPYNSQARGVIERLHKSLWIPLAKALDSYIGWDMDREAAQQFHKESRRGDKNGLIRLPISWANFIATCEDAMEIYNNRPHSSLPTIMDTETGKRRHMSPYEYRTRKMNTIDGYQHHTVTPEEADILFRPRVVRKILRAEINLFSNRYFNSELATRHGEELQIGYDIHDAKWVWVYDEDGRFLCKAEFNGNSRDYFPKPVIEQARDRRAAGRRKRAEKILEEIDAERHGGKALEALPIEEIPGMRAAALRVENRPVEMAATIPTSDQPRERFNFWRELDQRVKAGEDIPEGLRHFYIAYPKSADGRSWIRTYAADEQSSGAL